MQHASCGPLTLFHERPQRAAPYLANAYESDDSACCQDEGHKLSTTNHEANDGQEGGCGNSGRSDGRRADQRFLITSGDACQHCPPGSEIVSVVAISDRRQDHIGIGIGQRLDASDYWRQRLNLCELNSRIEQTRLRRKWARPHV